MCVFKYLDGTELPSGHSFATQIVYHDGHLYVVTQPGDPGFVDKIDVSDMSLVDTLSVGSSGFGLTGVAIGPDGYLYVTDSANPLRVLKIDTPTLTVQATLNLDASGFTAGTIVFDVANFKMFVANSFTSKIHRIDLHTFTVEQTVTVAGASSTTFVHAFDFTNGTLLVSESAPPVLFQYRGSDLTLLQSLSVGSGSESIGGAFVDVPGRVAYFGLNTGNRIFSVNLDSLDSTVHTHYYNHAGAGVQGVFLDNHGYLYVLDSNVDPSYSLLYKHLASTLEAVDVIQVPFQYVGPLTAGNNVLYFNDQDDVIGRAAIWGTAGTTITFRVNLTPPLAGHPSSSRTATADTRGVFLPDLNINNREIKHGTVFTETGAKALYLYDKYVLGEFPVLEVVCRTN